MTGRAAAVDPRAGAALYGEDYAARYHELYIAPWQRKHRIDAANLTRILDGLDHSLGHAPRWLDLACGQAWQFAMVPGRARQIGVDLSAAQLAHARRNAPGAGFLRADLDQLALPPGSIDLVTNFWAGYCYLGTSARIASLVGRAVDWLAEGGALYFEVLVPRDLETFNRSRYASRTGFAVTPLGDDYQDWQYDDAAGRHVMHSPPLELFLTAVAGRFRHVEAVHDGGFMIHLIATGRT
jgi:predicted TPR repeat methyltransferase